MQQECDPTPPRDQGLGTLGPQGIIKLTESLNIWEKSLFLIQMETLLVKSRPSNLFHIPEYCTSLHFTKLEIIFSHFRCFQRRALWWVGRSWL